MHLARDRRPAGNPSYVRLFSCHWIITIILVFPPVRERRAIFHEAAVNRHIIVMLRHYFSITFFMSQKDGAEEK